MNNTELELLIKEGEGLRVEFKEQYSSKIDRDLVAFANSKGGYLLLGVNDKGEIVGEQLSNKLKAAIVDLARKCEPGINIINISQIDQVVVIAIQESEEKPHSCSQGFYRRLDAVTQKMTQKEIKLLFKEDEFKSQFENRLCEDATLNDISAEKIKSFFQEANITTNNFYKKDILTSLNLLKNSGIKNAGILFFANDPRRMILQCQMTLVAYKGTKGVHIYDRIDVQNDLLTQYNAAQSFLQKHLNIRSEIKGFNRTDLYEIPMDALREAVANAIIHRDYSVYGTSLMIEIHEDRVVITNPGGIPSGVDIKSLLRVSMRRNELIADLFARINKIERLGSGLRRIYDAMQEASLPKPKIESDCFFTITFKRPFYSEQKQHQKPTVKLDDTAKLILAEIRNNPHITAKELAESLELTLRAVEKQLANLKSRGIIERAGSRKAGYWKVSSSV